MSLIDTTNLPSKSGVYLFYAGKEIIYIGKSVNIKARVASHLENAKLNIKEAAIVNNATYLKYLITDSEFKALLLESKLIQQHRPKYNSVWKDDRSYLYIKITKELFPKIYAVRKENDQRSSYFGPFSSQRQVSLILREIRKVFPFCSQKKISKHPCFHSKINLCHPCPNLISGLKDKKLFVQYRRQYLKNIRLIKNFFQGKDKKVLAGLKQDLKKLTEEQKFEEAIIIRNKIQIIENFLLQKITDFDYAKDYNLAEKNLVQLRELLLPFLGQLDLHRIEGYDISNLNQKEATASLVVMTDGLIDKGEYKKFKIKNLKLNNDFEMLKETLMRRFKNSWPKPDLIMIDGGRPQVKIIVKTLLDLNMQIPVIGLAKNPDRLVVGDATLSQIRKGNFQLLQQLRDEAHRFAKKYHLYLRNKKFLV